MGWGDTREITENQREEADGMEADGKPRKRSVLRRGGGTWEEGRLDARVHRTPEFKGIGDHRIYSSLCLLDGDLETKENMWTDRNELALELIRF